MEIREEKGEGKGGSGEVEESREKDRWGEERRDEGEEREGEEG